MFLKNHPARLFRALMLTSCALSFVLLLQSAAAAASGIWLASESSPLVHTANEMIQISGSGKIAQEFSYDPNIYLAQFVVGPRGNLWLSSMGQFGLYHYSRDGKVLGISKFQFYFPIAMAFDDAGNVWVANRNHVSDTGPGKAVNYVAVFNRDAQLVKTFPLSKIWNHPCQILHGHGPIMWIGASDGIYQASLDGGLRKVAATDGCPAIQVSPSGHLWFIDTPRKFITNGLARAWTLSEYNDAGMLMHKFIVPPPASAPKSLLFSLRDNPVLVRDFMFTAKGKIWIIGTSHMYVLDHAGRMRILPIPAFGYLAVGAVPGGNGSIWRVADAQNSVPSNGIMIEKLDDTGNVVFTKSLYNVEVEKIAAAK